MPNPSPIYVVSFGGEELPGYVQTDDRPLSLNHIINRPIGRDGGTVSISGANLRDISLTFLVKSSLGSGATGLQHLDDCMDQYRAATAILTRSYTEQVLQIHDTDRYYLATTSDISMPMNANQSRSFQYTVSWLAQPYAIGTTAVTDTIAGNGTISLAIGTDSRKTSPIFTVPATVETFTAVDPNGKTIEFVRGTQLGTLAIDCGKLRCYRTLNLTNGMRTMENLNFGMYYNDGTGTYDIDITGYTGSGTITVNMYPRYEL